MSETGITLEMDQLAVDFAKKIALRFGQAYTENMPLMSMAEMNNGQKLMAFMAAMVDFQAVFAEHFLPKEYSAQEKWELFCELRSSFEQKLIPNALAKLATKGEQ